MLLVIRPIANVPANDVSRVALPRRVEDIHVRLPRLLLGVEQMHVPVEGVLKIGH